MQTEQSADLECNQEPPEAVGDYLAELRKLTAGDIRTDAFHRVMYSTDASIYQVLPHAVVLPRTSDELQAAVELAAKHRVPILPRAGGSSLAGQAVNTAVMLDLRRYLDGILEVNKEEKWVRVQPGVVLDVLNAENELFIARSNLVTGRFSDVLNRYAIQASQGTLVSSLAL